MRTIPKFTALLLIVLLVSACTQQKRKLDLPNIKLTTDYLIPNPVKVTATNSSFPLDKYTAIITSGEVGVEDIGLFLSEKIEATTNLKLLVNPNDRKDVETVIYIQLKNDFESDSFETYELNIRQDSIILQSASTGNARCGTTLFHRR